MKNLKKKAVIGVILGLFIGLSYGYIIHNMALGICIGLSFSAMSYFRYRKQIKSDFGQAFFCSILLLFKF